MVLWLHGPSIAEEATADRNDLKNYKNSKSSRMMDGGPDSRQGVREASRDQVIN